MIKGAVMSRERLIERLSVMCDREECFGNICGRCMVLHAPLAPNKRSAKCPFLKSQKRLDAELDALRTYDWDAYHQAQRIR